MQSCQGCELEATLDFRWCCSGCLDFLGLHFEQVTLGTDFYDCLIMVLAGSDEDGIFRNLVHETMLMVYPA